MDERRASIEDAVWADAVNIIADDLRMDFIFHLIERTRRDDPVLQERLHRSPALGAKSFLHRPVARLRGQLNNVVRRMIGLKRPREELRSKKMKMLFHRKDGCFGVEMFDGRCLVGAGDETKGAVLNELETTN